MPSTPKPCNHCGGPVNEYTVRADSRSLAAGQEMVVKRRCINNCPGSQSLAGKP